MDPNANLSELRGSVRDVEHTVEATQGLLSNAGTRPTLDEALAQLDGLANSAGRLAELVGALDGWLTTGGFLPAAWDARPRSPASAAR